MSVLTGLAPERVFYFFEEISKIPHGSFHTKQISDYLVNFAKVHGLEYRQDESNNVIIKKPAAKGYEQAPTVILQGHCDMVCEKVPDSTHDFSKDPLQLIIEGDFVTAKDTTLGADDGIAVAFGLAIMEDKKLLHPPLELVITTDEEVGLLGAGALDTSDLNGSCFINLDSEEEGYLWVSCAGGLTADSQIPVRYIDREGAQYELIVDGLKGGHSGTEIDKIRANSNKLMGRLLFELGNTVDFSIAKLSGGLRDNVIPRATKATIIAAAESEEQIFQKAADIQDELCKEYYGTDNEINIKVLKGNKTTIPVLDMVSQQKIIFFLVQVPYGVQKMSGEIEGLVETSLNLGVLELGTENCQFVNSIRSSFGSAKRELRDKVIYLTEFLGGTCGSSGDYPAWEYRKDSKLRQLMVTTYQELFQEEPKVVAVHAGLECGLFYEKIPGLDCVSIGPDIKDIHTTEERLSISSTARTWNYLLNVLEKIHS